MRFSNLFQVVCSKTVFAIFVIAGLLCAMSGSFTPSHAYFIYGEGKILPDGGAENSFGESVSVSGDYAVVGAYYGDDNGDGSGSAYIFRRNSDGSWVQQAKLVPDDGAAYEFLGHDSDNRQRYHNRSRKCRRRQNDDQCEQLASSVRRGDHQQCEIRRRQWRRYPHRTSGILHHESQQNHCPGL